MASRGNTIRDVARDAGVSISTVSKAFNNKGSLKAATRQHVLSVAADLHFTPNALIRSLRRGQTYAIGVFTWDAKDDPSHDITASLSRGIARGITTAVYDMVVYSHMPGRVPSAMASVFLDGRIDGVIVGPEDVDEPGLSALAAADFPTVALYRREVPEGVGYVALENAAGVRQATEHLIALGHRRIAFYAPSATYDFVERAEGYRQALHGAGIPFDPDLHDLGRKEDDYWKSHIPACERWMKGSVEPPTALIAGDDSQALLWLEEFAKLGIRVPEDISVVGFDDVAAAASRRLTTIRQPTHQVGQLAAQFVKAMIDGTPAEECRAVLPVELICRESTAPPPLKRRLSAAS